MASYSLTNTFQTHNSGQQFRMECWGLGATKNSGFSRRSHGFQVVPGGGTSSCKVALCLSGIFNSVSSELFRTVYKYPPVPPTLKQNNTKNPLSLAFPPPHLVSFGSFSPQSLPPQQNFPKALPALPLAKHHSMPAPCWAPTSSLASGVLLGQSPDFLTPLGTVLRTFPPALFIFIYFQVYWHSKGGQKLNKNRKCL